MIYYSFSELTETAKNTAINKLANSIKKNSTPTKGQKHPVLLARDVLEDGEDQLLYTGQGVLIGMFVRTEDIE